MVDKKYDLSNAKVVGVVIKDPVKEKEKRIDDEKFRNASFEERQKMMYEEIHKYEE